MAGPQLHAASLELLICARGKGRLPFPRHREQTWRLAYNPGTVDDVHFPCSQARQAFLCWRFLSLPTYSPASFRTRSVVTVDRPCRSPAWPRSSPTHSNLMPTRRPLWVLIALEFG